MRVSILPGKARGEVKAPPSKSMAHRLLISAALADPAAGESRIAGIGANPSEDIRATADCLRALGASVEWEGEDARVRGCRPEDAPAGELFCRESGSTLRFLLPLCLLSGSPMRLSGKGRLPERPLTVYEELSRTRGFRLERDAGGVTVAGRLSPGEYAVPGDVSSQFATGLLFALPLLEGESTLRLIPPVESRAYIDMTVSILEQFGADIAKIDEHTFRIRPSRLLPREVPVEGDWSNAAFFYAFNAARGTVGGMEKGAVEVTGLNGDSLQGDRVCREYFAKLTGPAADADGSEPSLPVLDVKECPDLAPVLFSVAALSRGGVFTGTARLKFKESDRGAVMAEELSKFGADLQTEENRITVLPAPLHPPKEPLSSHGDHRVAMALSVVSARFGGVIEGAEAVGKSFPDYWERLRELGLEVKRDDGLDQ